MKQIMVAILGLTLLTSCGHMMGSEKQCSECAKSGKCADCKDKKCECAGCKDKAAKADCPDCKK